MSLVFYNTLSHEKEPFTPFDPDNVGLYVCGPTVYDTAHIGNARAIVAFDVLYRVLKAAYPRVTYVRNITDIDDKIIDAARANHEPISLLTQRTTARFHEDMASLGTLPPTHEPRATAYVPHMISFIAQLIEQKHAYEASGHVLFEVRTFPGYGHLSGLSLDAQRAGARVEKAPYKKDPADFVLWKPSPENDPLFPGWSSPWGYGRPGWHIECSAMSAHFLGVPFDIHGGGQDLIFPHHENEIAQSCCGGRKDLLARFWMHNGILTVEGEKMSKSLGNFVSVPDVLHRWPGEVIRWVLLSAHYRQALDWSEASLRQGKAALDRLYGALRGIEGGQADSLPLPDKAFLEALHDDLNTPQAQAYLHHLAGRIHKAGDPEERFDLAQRLQACGAFLGFFQMPPQAWFQGVRDAQAGLEEPAILAHIARRNEARGLRDFAMADQIRRDLLEGGIALEDGPEGTIWKRVERSKSEV